MLRSLVGPLSGASLVLLSLLAGCGGDEAPIAQPTPAAEEGTSAWTGKPDPSVVGGPSEFIEPDIFHPARQLDDDGNRPDMPTPRYGGRVIVHLASMPKHINYMTENSAVSRWMLREVHDSLLMRNWSTWDYEGVLAKEFWVEDRVELKDGRRLMGKVAESGDSVTVTPLSPQNDLAKAETVSKDDVQEIMLGTVITMDLVDAKWHDGHVFDSSDVRFTWECYQNPHVDCDDARQQQNQITECLVLGPKRVRMIFGKQYFLTHGVLEDFTIVPSHRYNLLDSDNPDHDPNATPEQQGQWVNDTPLNFEWIGLGAYKIVKVDDQYIEAERVKDHWQPERAGFVDKIRWRCIPDDQAAKTAVLNGELDYFARISSDEYYGAFCGSEAFKKSLYRGYFYQPRMQYIAWNSRRPELADRDVRMAIAHAVDWDEFIRTQSNGLSVRVTSTNYYLSPMYDHSIQPVPYDLEAAEELLDDAGWIDHNGDGIRDKDGVELKITYMMTPGNEASKKILLLMQESLGKIGIEVTSEEREWAVFIEHVKNKDFMSMGMAWILNVESDPHQLWHSESGENRGSNYPGVYHPRIDELIELIQVTIDDEKRREYWFELTNLIHDLQPYMFTYNPANKFVMNQRIRGFKAYGLNPGYSIRDWFIVDDSTKDSPRLEK